jgi:hypothetical protein
MEFHKAGERWTHGFFLAANQPDDLVPIAAAVEGDAARDDPARVVSPVYQDLQEHPAVDDVCALLTGQSTPHHFSVVVTTRRAGSNGVIEFDVADRCRAAIAVLAATYLVQLGSSALIDANPEGILWGGPALGRGQLEFTAGRGGTVALAEAGRQATRVQALARLDPTTHTQRLVYSWRWTPPD